MRKLTKKQIAVLDFIAKYSRSECKPPTIQEIANKFGIKSSTAFSHVKALIRKGKVTKGRQSPRSIRIVKNDDNLYGYSIVSGSMDLKPAFFLMRYDMETGKQTEIARFKNYAAVLLFMDEVGYGKVTEDMESNESSNV